MERDILLGPVMFSLVLLVLAGGFFFSSERGKTSFQKVLFNIARLLAVLEHRLQTPWNSLLFQCHLPGISAISVALGSVKVLSRRFL